MPKYTNEELITQCALGTMFKYCLNYPQFEKFMAPTSFWQNIARVRFPRIDSSLLLSSLWQILYVTGAEKHLKAFLKDCEEADMFVVEFKIQKHISGTKEWKNLKLPNF